MSVTELISVLKVFVANAIVSFDAPCTWGIQRKEYGSWIFLFFWYPISLPSNKSKTRSAVITWPLWGRTKCTSGSKGLILQLKASIETQEIKSDK